MTIVINAYKNGSASAKALAAELGCKILLKKNSKFRGKDGDTIINWGDSKGINALVVGKARVHNSPAAVLKAANKLRTQEVLTDKGNEYTLPHTTDKKFAGGCIQDGFTFVCRTKLTGHSGEGIVIAKTVEELVDAPLYTVYKKKTDEYRIHVMDGEIIDVQRKARKKDVADNEVNWQVRNLDGGFIFARDNIVAPLEVCKAALTAVNDLGLFNGAVDVGYHAKEGTYVYEVNTACGLAGSTLHNYAQAYRKALGLPLKKDPEGYVPMAKQPIQVIDEAINGGAPQEQVDMPQLERDVLAERAAKLLKDADEALLVEEPVRARPQHWGGMFGMEAGVAAVGEFDAEPKQPDGLRIKHGNIDVVIPEYKMGDVIVALMEKGLI